MSRAVLFYVDRSRILRMLSRQPRDARAPFRPLRRCDHRTMEYFTSELPRCSSQVSGNRVLLPFSVFRCYELTPILGL